MGAPHAVSGCGGARQVGTQSGVGGLAQSLANCSALVVQVACCWLAHTNRAAAAPSEKSRSYCESGPHAHNKWPSLARLRTSCAFLRPPSAPPVAQLACSRGRTMFARRRPPDWPRTRKNEKQISRSAGGTLISRLAGFLLERLARRTAPKPNPLNTELWFRNLDTRFDIQRGRLRSCYRLPETVSS